MKSKVFVKIALSLLISILIIATIGSVMFTYAADNFDISGFEEKSNSSIDNPTNNITQVAVTVIRIVGVGVALIIIMTLAMKYMMAAPGDRAEIKKSSIQYVIGAIVVFGASNILSVIIKIVQEAFPG